MRLALALLAATLAGGALAQAPAGSLRPVPRGGEAVVQPVEVDPSGSIRQAQGDDESVRRRDRGGLMQSLRPLFPSPKVAREADTRRQQRARGALCGDIDIQGEAVGRVTGRIAGCGIEDAVRVRAVAGVGLTAGAVMDCRTADALKRWVAGSAKPAFGSRGGGLRQLRVAAHYVCRTRNNQSGGKISEHGRGRAVDISGFLLADGTEVSVLRGWTDGNARVLREVHRGACGPFGTVLGPAADRFHRDHFHFDTARYRSGTYCR